MRYRRPLRLTTLAAAGLAFLFLYLRIALPSHALVFIPFVPCSGAHAARCVSASAYPSIETALIFDRHIPPEEVKSDEINAHVRYVWGATAPEPTGGVAKHHWYIAWAQGFCPIGGMYSECRSGGPPSPNWLRRRHPSWILWQTNKQGRPTRPAQDKANHGPIIDFTNPHVRRYWMKHYIAPYLKEGFNGIAWDNPVVYDPYGAVGHFNVHHHFVRQFTGNLQDATWAKAQVKAMGQLLQGARRVHRNVEFSLNLSFDCVYAPISLWFLPLRHITTIVDEEGYSNWGEEPPQPNYIPSSAGRYCSNRWLDKTDTYIREQKAGKHLVIIDQEPYEVYSYMTDEDARARKDLEWALANYLLVRYSHTYLWFGAFQKSGYGYPLREQREELANVGKPLGDMTPAQGVYMRRFRKGLAMVNPDPVSSFTVTLPVGEYKDLYGQTVNVTTLLPHSGLVLVKRAS